MLAFVAMLLLAAFAGGSDLRAVSLDAGEAPLERVVVQVLDNLVDHDVLALNVTSAQPGANGTVSQCRLGVDGFIACRNPFPVTFDDNGRALFQYRLHDDGSCGPTDSCVVVVNDQQGRIAWAYTVFGAPAPPPPAVAIAPPGPYTPGDIVDVVVGPMPPGTRSDVAFCTDTCTDPVLVTAAADGLASARLAIGDRCDVCGVRVRSGPGQTYTGVAFVAPPSADYHVGRLAAGLAVALALALTAWWLIRTTDWRAPSEALTPELDAFDEEVVDA